MKICLAVILYFLINSNSLNAHELWLEANQYQLKGSDKLIANIKVGQDLVGESYPYLSQETEKAFFSIKKRFEKIKSNRWRLPSNTTIYQLQWDSVFILSVKQRFS